MKSKFTVETIFIQREKYPKRYNISGYLRQYFIQDLVSFIISLLDGNNKIILRGETTKGTEKDWNDGYI